MSSSAIGRRYARAIFGHAHERGEVDKVIRDLTDLLATWRAGSMLPDAFENPAISSENRRQIIREIATQMGLGASTAQLWMLLSDRRRVRYLPEVIEAFLAIAEEKAGRVRAEVVSAAPLSDAYVAELQRTLEAVTGKKVSLVARQDASLIAGVVTRVGDKVFDGSLKNRLGDVRDGLLSS